MRCKDSDAFALEKYIDNLLDFNSWKNTYQLIVDFEKVDKEVYSDLVKAKMNNSKNSNNRDTTEFIDAVMNKLCFLFPMKYERCNYDAHSEKIALSDLDKSLIELSNKTYMYKRKLGFNQ